MSQAFFLAPKNARRLAPVLAALLLVGPAKAEEPVAFDAKQEDAIREIVRDYLLANPESTLR